MKFARISVVFRSILAAAGSTVFATASLAQTPPQYNVKGSWIAADGYIPATNPPQRNYALTIQRGLDLGIDVTVYFESGDYLVDRMITIPATKRNLKGDGPSSRIIATKGTSYPVFFGLLGSELTFADLCIRSNRTQGSSDGANWGDPYDSSPGALGEWNTVGLYLEGCSGVHFRNVEVRGFGRGVAGSRIGGGVYLASVSGVANEKVSFVDCRFEQNGGAGAFTYGDRTTDLRISQPCHQTIISDNFILSNSDIGVQLNSLANLPVNPSFQGSTVVSGNVVENHGRHGISLSYFSSSQSSDEARVLDVAVSSNIIRNNGFTGIYANDTAGTPAISFVGNEGRVGGLVIANNILDQNGGVVGAEEASLTGGISIFNRRGSTTITGNHITRTGVTPGTGSYQTAGIRLAACESVLVTSNTIEQTVGPAISHYGYIATIDGNLIRGVLRHSDAAPFFGAIQSFGFSDMPLHMIRINDNSITAVQPASSSGSQAACAIFLAQFNTTTTAAKPTISVRGNQIYQSVNNGFVAIRSDTTLVLNGRFADNIVKGWTGIFNATEFNGNDTYDNRILP